MSTALIFPGQASQSVGMGRDLYESFDIAKEMFLKANDILGFDLTNVCFNGPLQALTQTKVTQPALFVVSSILSKLLLDNNFKFSAVAGHSLGEYSALYAAGVFTYEEGLELVKVRAESMQIAGEKNPGTMAAILNLDKDMIQEACDKASGTGIVKIANHNSPGQIAISGDIEAVQEAMRITKELGAKRAIQLEVGGAFHSPLMSYATEKLQEKLATLTFCQPAQNVYCNVDAEKHRDPNNLTENLVAQIESAVLWSDIIQNMKKDGISKCIEVGPGKVLRGLVKRIDKDMALDGFSNVTDLAVVGIH
ncbi:MAG: ACP S-malonyltransferase [Candidatus Marinimicrobia bacterium]|nr:ACP S-malonyltransferase [Candidatus Neomarinimicrobiota bacterium]